MCFLATYFVFRFQSVSVCTYFFAHVEFACARGVVEQDEQTDRTAQKVVFPYERLQPIPDGKYTNSINVFSPTIAQRDIFLLVACVAKGYVVDRTVDGLSWMSSVFVIFVL